MGVVKKSKPKNEKNAANKIVDDVKRKKEMANGKTKMDGKVKKKKTVSCLQCIKSKTDDGGLEGKYRVAAPELMQDTFMSDSEDEGGEVECPIQQQQQYRYMNSEAGTLHRAKPLEDSVTDGHLWPSNNDRKVATIDRQPLDIGFLVSFVVDARGGAMKAKRRGGVRIIVPAAACAAPTRVTCRAATKRAPAAAPPPLMEGEALASRLLELQPHGAKFLAPVIIEVPIYTSACREREIVVLRSDTGDTWQDHYLHNNDNLMIQEALQRERQEHGASGETLGESGERVCRVVTCDFPHYLACVSRIRQEVHIIGPEGGTVSSAHTPQVQALFPASALTKRIRVGLQAHSAPTSLARRLLPRHVAVSPVLTVEPRRRKFHRTITLTAPLPDQHDGKPDKGSTSNLRLLCSIMGGQARAVWEDVTGSTPLSITEDCASFTTTVSARFWLMNCQNVSDATKLATELYREMLLVPFEVRIVVLGKRLDALEGRLLVLYITDRYAYDTLLQQEHYTEVAHSTAVRFLDGKEIYMEFSGNLVPVTKSGIQPVLTFESFKDNRVEFTVRVKHNEDGPSGRIYFMNEPKVPKGEQSQTPACVLDVELPDRIAPRAGKSQGDYLNLDQSGFDALKDELSFHWGDHNNSLGPGSLPPTTDKQLNGHDKIITNGNIKYSTQDTDTDDKDDKHQVNGDTIHVDSNKTKATFDSDEDKTPHNTLEKGKKKQEGGSFFGGIAGKVKNVFSHSEDKEDDSKESSPKPQPKPRESKEKSPPKSRESKEKSPPKPRESKEKSPPKPAPRIINEDLLDKVEDMFKDLHSKPHEQDDVESEVYATKLVVDEDHPRIDLKDMKENLYEQYAHMQPIETPIRTKTSDPFAFYIDCCDGKFKGQKHSHEETSNLADIIENANFTAHEKLGEVTDKVHDDLKDGLNKLEKEKDNIKQKGDNIADDLIEKSDKIKSDVSLKEQKIRSNIDDQIDNVKDSTNNTLDSIKNSASELHDNVNKTSAGIKDNIEHKVYELDFAARERAEQLRMGGHDKISDFGNALESASDNLRHKARESADVVVDSVHNLKDNLSHTTENLKSGAKETTENLKEATNDKLQQLSDSYDNAKEKTQTTAADLKSKASETKEEVKSKSKKKSKEGKNFLTGLVHNIFGEKDKLENEVKGKIAEGKNSANNLVEQASAKKEEIKDSMGKKQEEFKKDANDLAQSVQATKDEIEKQVHDKKTELDKTIHDKTDDAKQALQNKKNDVEQAVQEKADETTKALQSKKSDVEQAIQSKKEKLETAIQDKTDEASKALQEKKEDLIEIGNAIQEKTNEAKQSIQDKKEEAIHAIQSKKEDFEKALQDKTDESKKAFQDKKDQIVDEAKGLLDQASAKKDEIKNSAEKTKEDLKECSENILKSAEAKKDEITKSIHDTTNESLKAAKNKKEELKQDFHNKSQEIGATLGDKIDEVGKDFHNKSNELQNTAVTELDRIRQEAEHTTEQIKKSAEDALNDASYKKNAIKKNISNKAEELEKSGKEELENIQNAASDKANDLQRSSKQAFDHVHDSTLSTFDRVESSAKDKVSDAKDSWQDLQSSTRDTFADFKDDVHSWENSAQDTLHSLQSSAGNTFDSLDDSTREFMGGVHNTAQNVEGNTKEFFSDMNDSFKGFQVSSDNKLEDIKGSAKERLGDAEARLGEVQEGFTEGLHDAADTMASEADQFTSSLNDLGNSVFGSSGKGFMKDSSTKLLESEKAQSSPHKKSSGIPKLKRKK